MGAKRKIRVGLTVEEYDVMLAAQEGHCALCPNTPKTRRLDVDHDHKTGRIRQLLCHQCNRLLPTRVTPEWLRRAADYIERHNKGESHELDAEHKSSDRAAGTTGAGVSR